MIYENEKTIAVEWDMILACAELWHGKPFRFPKSLRSSVDGAILETPTGLVLLEVKARNNPQSQYPDLRVDVSKILAGCYYARLIRGARFVFAVKWADTGICVVEPTVPVDWRIDVMRRNRMGEEADLVFCIPNNLFTPITHNP